ncbi:helix-turn-helix domain-containing protein [Cobetia marina]|uniref:GlxA family transcriptional regulator n=1 Tax=Cobetia marina TaxID=28258 RepID=UPI0026E3CCC1|nr:helix-turn-helix domain-containing protein [Cobetia marina]MDO6786284.1 helix-turn-helix domain-containing protein [Cobetia marina]
MPDTPTALDMKPLSTGAHPYPRPDSPPVLAPGAAENTLNVWLVPRFSMLTLFCLLEPLRVANRFGRDLFAWRLLSADGEAVVASNGVRIDVDGRLDQLMTGEPRQAPEAVCEQASASMARMRLMVVSSYEPEASVDSESRAVLRWLAAHGAWLGGLDTAPFILARAGVLAGHPVALHWESVPAFQQEFPELDVSSAPYEWQGERLTGSGGAASIDMMLAWIERLYGPSLADAVGRQIMHQRTAVNVESPTPRDSSLPRSVVRALAVMEANLAQALPIPVVCRLAGQSQRQLTRLFVAQFGETPKQCYLGMRLDHAQRVLANSRVSVSQAAFATGFTHLAHFSRAYQQRFGEAPSVTARRGLAAE